MHWIFVLNWATCVQKLLGEEIILEPIQDILCWINKSVVPECAYENDSSNSSSCNARAGPVHSGHADDNAGLKNSIVRDSKIKRRSTLARGAEPSVVCVKKELI